ncbi:MAG: TIGR03086 family metal-binding protein [Acidimicrobiales bacterium]|nr:TIGR03086 family metal-binding protein [Acidimicrobiales bacterium]
MSDPLVTLFTAAIGRFADRVDAVDDEQWSDPTPCEDWDVRALVNHLCSEQRWAPHLLAGETMEQVGDRYDGDLLGLDPKTTFHDAMAGSVAAFERAASQGKGLDGIVHLSFGDVPCRVYLSQMLTDAEVHGWDLARALGRPAQLDDAVVELVLPEMQAQEQLIRSSGVFGPAVEIPADASDADRLLAILGRDPR